MSDIEQNTGGPRQTGGQFEQALVNQLAREFLREQRRARRWGIAFKLFFAAWLLLFLIIYLTSESDISTAGLGDGRHTALIDIRGIISSDGLVDADYVSADQVAAGLLAAYEDSGTVGVILRINSPGGAPVQAGYINDEIMRLKDENPDIPVYAVLSDLCASGGYYIAAAADKIYADKASLVGSIGVVSAGFGFVDTLNKLGIERRVHHTGKNKAFLDPFSPLREDEVKHFDQLLDNIYQQFVKTVKEGRGDRLVDDDRIFSGLIWTGEQSVELGLVDELGDVGYVAREVIGAENVVDFTYRDSWFEQLSIQISALFKNRFKSGMNHDFNYMK